ncbi:MAG: AMP-binding protein, partial [Sphaerotilus sp.]|nr:AMP-binding protein [Sphaerotilus sp.]
MGHSAYDQGLDRNRANFAALTPLTFLERTARIHPERIALIHGELRQTWLETARRCRRLASALRGRGIRAGDTVAAMLPNTPAMYECHFGVPMAGAVLNTLNTRLDPEAIAFQLDHGEAKVLLTDREFSSIIRRALDLVKGPRPLVIDVDDALFEGGVLLGEKDYEAFLAEGDPDFAWQPPADEWDAIALNYTSGTTGNPKGVVTHHRGAYLNATSNVVTWEMPRHAVYLWTLPMFHCNGWCFPWTMALQAGTSVCLRRVDPTLIFPLIREHRVTHMCGAPIVYGLLINASEQLRAGIDHPIHGLIAGAAPPAAIIEGCERIGIDITHVYGLTEVYGPAAVCVRQDGWEKLSIG